MFWIFFYLKVCHFLCVMYFPCWEKRHSCMDCAIEWLRVVRWSACKAANKRKLSLAFWSRISAIADISGKHVDLLERFDSAVKSRYSCAAFVAGRGKNSGMARPWQAMLNSVSLLRQRLRFVFWRTTWRLIVRQMPICSARRLPSYWVRWEQCELLFHFCIRRRTKVVVRNE